MNRCRCPAGPPDDDVDRGQPVVTGLVVVGAEARTDGG
jgi:hypothetical protein